MSFNSLITLSLILSFALACEHPEWMEQDRLAIDKDQGFSVINDKHLEKREESAKAGTWRPLNIFFDLTALDDGLRKINRYAQIPFYKKVFQRVGDWWGQALQVNDDKSEIATTIKKYWKNPTYKTYQAFEMGGKQMEDYDLLIRVHLGKSQGSVLAYAGPYVRHEKSQRPTTGACWVTPMGDQWFMKKSNPFGTAVGTMIHEFGHIIAFISFERMHAKLVQKPNSSSNLYKWIGPNVKEVATTYYGAQSQGVALQSYSNRAGGHWDETALGNEMMTPSTGGVDYVSTMTLALCADTKWYKPQMTFSENYTKAKNSGRTMLADECKNECTLRGGSIITSDRQGLGVCKNDNNDCPVTVKYANRDCMKGATWSSNYSNHFGSSFGANCTVVMGKFKTAVDPGLVYTYPINVPQVSCDASYSSYNLTFKDFKLDSAGAKTGADAVVKCLRAGDQKFNDFGGPFTSTVTCEEPKTFCTARFGTIKTNGGDKCPGGGGNGGDGGGNGGDGGGNGGDGGGNGGTTYANCGSTCAGNGRCQDLGAAPTRVQMELNMLARAPQAKSACWCYQDGRRSTTGDCPKITL